MTHIEQLNQRFADALGGEPPRFKWELSTNCFYYIREHAGESFTRNCWADKLGRVWLICMWDTPKSFDPRNGSIRVLAEADWWKSFKGTIPFPKRGEYVAKGETWQRRPPTGEDTAYYIRTLDAQMSTSYDRQLDRSNLELALLERQRDYEFDGKIDEAMTPAFGNWNFGRRGGSVSFGGI